MVGVTHTLFLVLTYIMFEIAGCTALCRDSYTTRLTCPNSQHRSLQTAKTLFHLKEPLRPPHTEDRIPRQYAQLQNTPPLDPRIRALRRVSVRSLPDHNVALLILDLRQ